MTTAADDRAVEDAFEAYLAGRPVLGEGAALASFGEAVRGTATQPGRPSAALAELLATGLLADQPSPSSRTGRTRRRRRLPMIFPALLAKLLSAGAVAQAATGAAVVVVVATGAGATGVLGADVQDTVTSVVGITSEEEVGDDVVADDETTAEEPTAEPTGEETLPEAPVVEEDVVPADTLDVEAWTADGPDGYGSFSAWVTAGAHDPDLKDELRATGRNFGSVVRQWAGWKGMSEEELAEEGVDLDGLDEPADVPAAEPIAEPTTDPGTPTATTERGNGRSNGNGGSTGGGSSHGNGNGNGNAAKGNGRN